MSHCLCEKLRDILGRGNATVDLCQEWRLSLLKKRGEDADITYIKGLFGGKSVPIFG